MSVAFEEVCMEIALSSKYMWLVFFAAMAGLWLLGLLAAKYLGRKSLIIFIGGDDDRLSLSKAQAFAWTLIIMSSYLAAMAVHKKFLPSDQWITIPPDLLALAGIVIGSGVFSSVISAIKEEKRTAEVTRLDRDQSVFTITGTALGKNRGAVRIVGSDGKRWELSVSHWDDTEVKLLIDPTVEKRIFGNSQAVGRVKKNTLIVDTRNGKASYRFDDFTTTTEKLEPIVYYEFVDFFRDDQNPSILSIMKYQMFAWTVIAIVIYTYIFLQNPSDTITTLPVLHRTFVILMGLSQAGYLGGKAMPTAPAP